MVRVLDYSFSLYFVSKVLLSSIMPTFNANSAIALTIQIVIDDVYHIYAYYYINIKYVWRVCSGILCNWVLVLING